MIYNIGQRCKPFFFLLRICRKDPLPRRLPIRRWTRERVCRRPWPDGRRWCRARTMCKDLRRSGRVSQRTLTVGGSITVRLVSSFTSLDLADLLHTKTTYVLFGSSPVLLNWRPAVQWSFPQRWVFSGWVPRQAWSSLVGGVKRLVVSYCVSEMVK